MAEQGIEKTASKAEDASATPAPSEAPAPTAAQTEEVPDPDEDNLDELDDLLDDFSATSVAASGPGRPSSAAPTSRPHHPALPNPSASAKDPSHDADFSNELQKEMAALLGEIDESPEMRRQLEELMSEVTAGAERTLEEDEEGKVPTKAADGGDRSATAKEASQQSGGASAAAEPAFTDTIRRTMERMAESGQQASAAVQQGGVSEEDMLAQLLKEVAGGGGGGEASEEEFSKMLMGMMEQLTNKDILYEPMKELDTKFPDWMKANEGKVPKEDMRRYKEQQGLVEEIVARFERQGYSDENPQDREFIVERMQKMQAAGSPPQDLIGDMKDAQEALGGLGPDCPQQ